MISTLTRKASAYIQGINFNTDLKNHVHLLLGKKFAPKGYAYLIIQNGHGTIASAFKKTKNIQEGFLENCTEYFKSKNINFFEAKKFSSRGSFMLPFGQMNLPILVGEAGGFQDYLFGFGMRMSMLSGLVAAMRLNNEHLKAKVERYIKSNDVPHLLLFGRAGTGKTTLAKLIVKNIDCDYIYKNASDENSVDTVRKKVRKLESKIDIGRGPIANVIVTTGTLKKGDFFVSGLKWGKVRAIINDKGQNISEAPPSTPVEVLGINGAA